MKDKNKYKLVRRGQKYCVRVQGVINTTDSFKWCTDRKMSYYIKQRWITRWEVKTKTTKWDYDFIFDKEYEATAFIIGYLIH